MKSWWLVICDLDQYMVATLLVLINKYNGRPTDNQVHVHNSYVHDIMSGHLKFINTYFAKEKQWRMKGLNMVQWINLNWDNRSIVVHQFPLLWEKTGPILPPLWQAEKIWWISKFLELYKLNYWIYTLFNINTM